MCPDTVCGGFRPGHRFPTLKAMTRIPSKFELSAALALLAGLAAAPARAVETCRFAGSTSHDGRFAAQTVVSEADGLLTVDVTVSLTASAWLADLQYMGEEISTWRTGVLQSVAVNARTLINGDIKRQQWDVFVRDAGGLRARRVQAKTLADFRQLHPGFVRHWASAAFGQPWLQDYAAAGAARRPDLDSLEPPQGLRTPLAFSFYWTRFLPDGGGPTPLFLPGFKHDARVSLALGPVEIGQGWRHWKAGLSHPALETGVSSSAAAWVSPDHYLLQLAFDIHTNLGNGQAIIRTQGCKGIQVPPS